MTIKKKKIKIAKAIYGKRTFMSSEEFENFRKLVNGSGEFKDILEIIVRKKEAEQLYKLAEENN